MKEHLRRFQSPLFLIACALALVLAFHVPPAYAQKPDNPGKGNGGGGGGKDDGGTGEFPATMDLRDGTGDRILGDGATYDEGVRIRDDGLLLINVSDPRTMTFDFTDLAHAAECSICKKNFETVTTGGIAASVEVMQDGSDQTLEGNLLGMAAGESKRARLKLGWGSSGGKNGVRWSVRFKFPMGEEPVDTGILTKTHYAQISRITQDTWIIEAALDLLGDHAMLVSQFKEKGHQTQDEGTYHMPFQMTIICPSCP